MNFRITRLHSFKTFLLLLTLSVTTVMLDYRRPDALTNAQFWMEDGEIFFLDSYNKGFLSIFYPYAQYLHVFPRTISILGNYFIPISLIPLFYNISSFLTFILTAIYIWFRGSENKIISALMILTLTLLPVHNEVFMNITNQQWSLSLILLLPLAYTRYSKTWSVLDFFLILISGLSGPFSVIFFPIVLVKYYYSKGELKANLYAILPFLAYAFTACLQAISIYFHPMQRSIGGPGIIDFLLASAQLFYQQFAALTGDLTFIYLRNSFTVTIGIIFFASLLHLWFLSFKNTLKSKNPECFVFLSASLALFVSTLYGFRNNPGILDPVSADRYFYISTVTFFWAIFNFFEQKSFLLYCSALGFLALFIFRNKIIPTKTLEDMEWRKYAEKFEQSEPFEIPINPPNRGWIIKVVPKK